MKRLPKSRFATISTYISEADGGLDDPSMYNDMEIPLNEGEVETLRNAGVDETLARHVAHYFTRDPVVVFKERIELDDVNEKDHWENVNSMNWQSVRIKPPPPNSDIGWRVEARPCDVAVTDFENTAMTAFIVLLCQAAEHQGVDWRIPISQLDENMDIAHAKEAVTKEDFFWRADNGGVEKMRLDRIVNGKGGLMEAARRALARDQSVTPEARATIERYLAFVAARASGEILTTATWLREQITSHPEYQHDSVVSEGIAFDLLKTVQQISRGDLWPVDLLGGRFTLTTAEELEQEQKSLEDRLEMLTHQQQPLDMKAIFENVEVVEGGLALKRKDVLDRETLVQPALMCC